MTVANLSTWWEFLDSVAQPSTATSDRTFASNEDFKNGILARLSERYGSGRETSDAKLVEGIVFRSLDDYREEAGEELYSAVRSVATFTVS